MKGKRTSKYKSIVGEEKSNKFTNINLVSEVTEGKLIACNGSFIAASWNSTVGSVAILNTHFPSNVKFNCPVLRGHKYSVFDLEFSPLKDTLLATASDDATVKLWDIPPEGLTENMNQDIMTYKGHTRRVSFVKFNPVAADVIASASTDYTLQVWNLVKGETYSQVEFDDLPTSLDWNPIGSLVGVTNKKKTINIFDPREKKSVLVTQIYESPKSPKFTWVGENTFVTTGFSKQNVKELKLWDIRKVTEDLKSEGPVQKLVIDNLTTTIATPFYDHESKLLFTSGKGELTIHCYDLNDSIIYPNADFKSKTPALSLNMFERRVLDYNKCEIDRFIHYNNKKELSFISFYIARKNPEYEPDLYPPVSIPEAALTYDQWIAGENKEPLKKEIHLLDNKYVSKPENYIPSSGNSGDKNDTLDSANSDKMKIIEEKVNEKQKIYDNLLKEKEDLENKLKELQKRKEEANDKLNSAMKLKAKKDEQKNEEESKKEEEKEIETKKEEPVLDEQKVENNEENKEQIAENVKEEEKKEEENIEENKEEEKKEENKEEENKEEENKEEENKEEENATEKKETNEAEEQ